MLFVKKKAILYYIGINLIKNEQMKNFKTQLKDMENINMNENLRCLSRTRQISMYLSVCVSII